MIVMSADQKTEFEKMLAANQDKYDARFYHWEPVPLKDGTFVLNEDIMDDPNFAALKIILPGKVVYEEKQVQESEFPDRIKPADTTKETKI